MSEASRERPTSGISQISNMRGDPRDDVTETRSGEVSRLAHIPKSVSKTVQSLPIMRQEGTPDPNLVCFYAVSVLLGHTDDQRGWTSGLLPLYYQCPPSVPFHEWLPERINQHDKEWMAISDYKHDKIVLDLCKLNLSTAGFYDFCKQGLRPIQAAAVMMMTRPCENVVLTDRMLRWVLAARGSGGPVSAPDAVMAYAHLELTVRRVQRLRWPGLTSLACHGLIHGG